MLYSIRRLWMNGMKYPYFILMIAVHASPFFLREYFSWQALLFALFIGPIHGFSVTLGYHRNITHGSYQTYRPIRYALAMVPAFSGFDSVIHWVSTHRKHHQHTDTDQDPHSPKDSWLWGHCLCWLEYESWADIRKQNEKYTPDLLADPVMVWIDRIGVVAVPLSLCGHFGLGYLIGGIPMGCSFVTWCLFRMLLSFHFTWFVNSVAHSHHETGPAPYAGSGTGLSRNVRWVARLTGGEGWHNNHHKYPTRANHGEGPDQPDRTYDIIRLMRYLGLAWNVKDGIGGNFGIDRQAA